MLKLSAMVAAGCCFVMRLAESRRGAPATDNGRHSRARGRACAGSEMLVKMHSELMRCPDADGGDI